ncbi:U11/U12 small nuclear ribonucleoprotein 25 kDa protein-like isoform X1 [Apostichopus japonicus]|uniref:U11/U12 small nuclear ribonucleoprotein 25 kDa protein-like isoform X1 n=2 Tax=Stichopus japonicus TaxID=307972 RepID=UPI003AB5C2F5
MPQKMDIVICRSTAKMSETMDAERPTLPGKPSAVKDEPSTQYNMSERLTHEEVMTYLKGQLSDVLTQDPLLSDLPSDVTPEEVNLKIALEHGQAMTVFVRKADGEVLPIVVMQSATVRDLKNAIRRYMTLQLQRKNCSKKVSWRYIWRTYWLSYSGEKLASDKKRLKDYGVQNRAEVSYVKRLRRKGQGY